VIPTEPTPLVSHIRHFSLDDGPGIRTTVFLKGCPLSCVWCHNPESIRPEREVTFDPRACIGCGQCRDVCDHDALSPADPDRRIIPARCNGCGRCADACPARAIRSIGRYYPVDELVDRLLGDRVLYETSGGGVTFSGGEPTIHMEYLGEAAASLKKEGVHVALQTCGHFDMDRFRERLLPVVDTVYFDLKLIDPEAHRRYTGRPNRRILDNFQTLIREPALSVVATVPLVPRITATDRNIEEIVTFLIRSHCHRFELRPYHPGGRQKRAALGLPPVPDGPETPISAEAVAAIRGRFQAALDRGLSPAAPPVSATVAENDLSPLQGSGLP
jgi:pyruvate formate lyase activating enzyme